MKMPHRVACKRSNNRETVGKSALKVQKSRNNCWGNLRKSAASTCLLPATEAAVAAVAAEERRMSSGSHPSLESSGHNRVCRIIKTPSAAPKAAVEQCALPSCHISFYPPLAQLPSLCMQGVNICICNNNILMACPKCVRKSKRDLLLLLPVRVPLCVYVCACFVSRYADANNNKGAGAQAWRIIILATTTRGTTFGSIKSCWQHAVSRVVLQLPCECV